MSKISVAMAVYNGERFLPAQLDSILKQLEPQDELVISYDQSSDGTWEMIGGYASRYPQIRVLKNQDPGVIGNFNTAIAACTGDYIFMSDQDDVWADGKREKVVEAFASTGADVVIHNGVHIDGEGKPVSEPFFSIYRIGDGKIRNLLKTRYSGCCMAFTASMKEKILPIPADIDAHDRWVGLLGEYLGKIAYCDDVLLYHRLHGDNVTPTSTRSFSVLVRTRLTMIRELRRRIRREKERQNGRI